MNASKEKIHMALKLLEILEQFMINNFLIKITQFEKTGSIYKNYFAGKTDNKISFSR